MIAIQDGELDRTITIEARSTDLDDNSPALSWRDGNAGAATLWSAVSSTIRARVRTTAAQENLTAGAVRGETDYQVVYRYRSFRRVTESHRVVVTIDADSPALTKTLNIVGVKYHSNETSTPEWIELTCAEGLSNG